MLNVLFPYKKVRANAGSVRGSLGVAALYDQFEDSVRVREAIRGLHRFHDGEGPLNVGMWSFKSLESAEARMESLQASAAADLIIVATLGSQPVPQQIKDWLDLSLLRQCASDVNLVALYDGNPNENHAGGPFCTYLEHQAAKYQIDFMRSEEFAWKIGWDYPVRPVRYPVGTLTVRCGVPSYDPPPPPMCKMLKQPNNPQSK